jgi:hypothetical protein
MKHNREIGQATATNPSYGGGLLPLHGGDDGVESERVEKHPGVTPAAFPPPIFTGRDSVFVFRVSPPPPIAIVKGVYI